MTSRPQSRTVAEFRELAELYGANVACAMFERHGGRAAIESDFSDHQLAALLRAIYTTDPVELSKEAVTLIETGIRMQRAELFDGVAVWREAEGETAAALPDSETMRSGQWLATCDKLIDLFERPDFRLLAQFTI